MILHISIISTTDIHSLILLMVPCVLSRRFVFGLLSSNERDKARDTGVRGNLDLVSCLSNTARLLLRATLDLGV